VQEIKSSTCPSLAKKNNLIIEIQYTHKPPHLVSKKTIHVFTVNKYFETKGVVPDG
jgi:hypothetical protein